MDKKAVRVADANKSTCRKLCKLLEELDFKALPFSSLKSLEKDISKSPEGAVILDIDSLPVDNSFLKIFKKSRPDIYILVLSARRLHPELEEAMVSYIYASLVKPVDPEELRYWLDSLNDQPLESQNGSGS